MKLFLDVSGAIISFVLTFGTANSIFFKVPDKVKVCVVKSQQPDTTTVYHASTASLKSRFIPDQVFEMKNLRILSIQGMDCDFGDTTSCWMIREIPSQISRLKKLRTLRLNLHAIQAIPREIIALKDLQTFDLTDNSSLSRIDYVTALTNLKELYLFGCNLKKLPKNIGDLKNLKRLGLTGNDISRVELERIRTALPGCEIIYNN